MNTPEFGGNEEKKSSFIWFTSNISHWTGRPATFLAAVFLVIAWAVSGPFFHYSENWQLAINTSTTIVTFLMVFLIQSTQNRDTYALQLKLDELIRAMPGAHTELLDIENLSEERLCELRTLYADIAARSRENIAKGLEDTDCPPVEFHPQQGGVAAPAESV